MPTPTTGLAEDVLPLIRSRSDLHRWSAANAHGRDMHEAIDILEQDEAAGPAERYTVTHKALASAINVMARADESSGVIGDDNRGHAGLGRLGFRRPMCDGVEVH